MKRDIVWTTKFKKDYKLAIKRHMDIGLLDDISPIWHSSNVLGSTAQLLRQALSNHPSGRKP